MTVLARTVRATPYRSANEAWDLIVDLLAPQAGAGRDELVQVSGIAASLIASEAPAQSPIVVWGNGPRVRIYCSFGDDALSGDNANEQRLPAAAATGAWEISLPCPEEDLSWVQASLAKQSARISARKLGDIVAGRAEESEGGSQSPAIINKDAFFRLETLIEKRGVSVARCATARA